MTNSKKVFCVFMLLMVLGAVGLISMQPALGAPATFVVTTVNDTDDLDFGGTHDGNCVDVNGQCSLRAAIQEANATTDLDTINFNISGSGVQTIEPLTELPHITNPVVVDGFSQPGAQANTAVWPAPLNGTITIEIDGTTASTTEGGELTGLMLEGNASSGSTVRGLSVLNYTGFQMLLDGSQNSHISGNYLGVDHSGLVASTQSEFKSFKFANSPSNSVLGGALPSERNILTSKTTFGPGVELSGEGVHVYGNYLGIGRDGVTDLDSNFLSNINDGNVQVGGPNVGEGNLFAGAEILLTVTEGSPVIQGNMFGTDYTGNINSNITNGAGVAFTFAATEVTFGGINPGEGNIVRDVETLGVSVLGMRLHDENDHNIVLADYIPTKNAILGNTISDIRVGEFFGFGDSNLGIDISGTIYYGFPDANGPDGYYRQGPDTNDTGDTDTGPNDIINTPVLKSASQTGNQLTITYDLDATGSDSNEYRVEFYANDASTYFGNGPGENFLGAAATVTPGQNNTVTLTVNGDLTNKALSATTTAHDSTTSSGFGSTSEFSDNIEIGTSEDFDADGVPDEIEDAAPNGGDANDDSIADSLQSTVSTYQVDGTYVTFETEGCNANGIVQPYDESSLPVADANYTYPFGLTDFVLNCSVGDDVVVNKYIYTDANEISSYQIRKFIPTTNQYMSAQEVIDQLNVAVPGLNAPDATIETTTIGGENVLHLSYTLVDGQIGDDDAIANGVIVDPVGLAEIRTSSSPTLNNSDGTGSTTTGVIGTLAATGAAPDVTTPIWLLVLGSALWLLASFRSQSLRKSRRCSLWQAERLSANRLVYRTYPWRNSNVGFHSRSR